MRLVVLNFEQALVYNDQGELTKAYKWPNEIRHSCLNDPEAGMKAVQFMIDQHPEKLEPIDLASLEASLFTLETIDRHAAYSDWDAIVFGKP